MAFQFSQDSTEARKLVSSLDLLGRAALHNAAKGAPVAPELLEQLVTSGRELGQIALEYLERTGAVLRKAQVLSVSLERRVLDRPTALVALQGGELLTMALKDDELAESLAPGDVVDLTIDHRQVADVVGHTPPPALTTRIIRAVHHDHGRTTVEVGGETGDRDREGLIVAAGVPVAELRPGRSVRTWGRVAYELVADQTAGCGFLQSRRRPVEREVLPEEVIGADQRRLVTLLLTALCVMAFPERYPRRSRAADNKYLVHGRTGCGKSHTIQAAVTIAKRLFPDVAFFALSADEVRGSLVGQTTERVRDIIQTANELARRGQIVVVVLEEATTLLMDRSRSSNHLDSGVTLQASEVLMASLESVAGGLEDGVLLILTSNRADLADAALKGRFTCVPVNSFGTAELEQVLRIWFAREPDVYQADDWAPFRAALEAVLDVPLGSVLVGKDERTVGLRHLATGRLARMAHAAAARVLDQAIFAAGNEPDFAAVARVDPALLVTCLLEKALEEFPATTAAARERLEGGGLCRAGKGESLSTPAALELATLAIPEAYDARPLLAQVAAPPDTESWLPRAAG
jgi:hypothetical protein